MSEEIEKIRKFRAMEPIDKVITVLQSMDKDRANMLLEGGAMRVADDAAGFDFVIKVNKL